MNDRRESLETGTIIRFENGVTYKIIGSPIGSGGGSIIYPAHKIVSNNNPEKSNELEYALKECFPASKEHLYIRKPNGEIVSDSKSLEDEEYLENAKKMMLMEGNVTQNIYRTSSRLIPIREHATTMEITRPDQGTERVENAITVMDSIEKKGRSIRSYIREYGTFTPLQTFHLVRELLLALREVHEAGYLHLDIQDGNVFVQGSLDNESDFVSLIDFGASRKMENGKTDVIQDRVIFTTEGFSAPEILFENDGKLQLGPETDIYSVGCLILYMLTGTKFTTDYLLNVSNDRYLTRFKLRKIQCPQHLVDRMQAIIAHALKKDRHNRYHSVEEMLEDVNDFVKALAPYRSDLSSVDYDAFISYKHGPIDTIVAQTLQRKLENYRAPKGVGDKKKPFKRVFVDEGELSSCSDFGKQIEAALKNSGWLIVICSRNTPMSPWVKAEIETFLKYHDRSRILAVLIEGEPEQSFPEELLGNQDGVGEVFAAIARGDNLKQILQNLGKDALLKIVAPMLNVTFESLKQRQRTYRIKRIALASTALLVVINGFVTYAYIQSQKLNREYQNTLINQSQYLGAMAMEKLEENNPYEAIELALQALPNETLDRPLIADAEYALTKAVNAYSKDETLTVTGNYAIKGDKFFADTGARILFTCENEIIQLWDLDSKQSIDKVKINKYIHIFDETLLMKDKKSLIFATYNEIVCYDYDKKEIVWTYEAKDVERLAILPKANEVVYCNQEKIGLLDIDTGKEKTEMKLSIENTTLEEGVIALRKDEKKFVFDLHEDANNPKTEDMYSGEYDNSVREDTNDLLVTVDLETKDIQVTDPQIGFIGKIEFVDDDHLIIAGPNISDELQYGTNQTFFDGDGSYIANLTYYNLSSEKKLWSQEVRYSGASAFSCINDFQMMNIDGQLSCIYYVYDKCIRVDVENGKLLDQWEFQSPIVSVENKNKTYSYILTGDGIVNKVEFGKVAILGKKRFDGRIKTIKEYQDIEFVLFEPRSTSRNASLVEYQYRKDENWTLIEDKLTVSEGKISQTETNNSMMAMLENSNDKHKISCWVYQENNDLKQMVLDLKETSNILPYKTKLLGNYILDGREVLMIGYEDLNNEKSPCGIWCIDVKTLEDFTISIPFSEDQDPDLICLHGDSIYIAQNDRTIDEDGTITGNLNLYRWDINKNRDPEKIDINNQTAVLQQIGFTDNENEIVLCYLSDKTENNMRYSVYLVNMKNKASKKIMEQTLSSDMSAEMIGLENGKEWLFLTNDSLKLFDKKGRSKGELSYSLEDDVVVSVSVTPDQSILMVTEQGYLYKYSMDENKMIFKIDLRNEGISHIHTLQQGITWDYIDDDHVILNIDHNCVVVNISDVGNGIVCKLENCIAYDPDNDRFYILSRSGDTNEFGYFKRYTVDELVKKGEEILSN